MPAFEELLGRPADGIVAFAERSDWSHMLSSVNWSIGCWSGKPYRVAQSVPMLMDSGTSLAKGAAGAYDKHFVALGKLLVAKGRGNAYLRIGWEFNGDWYPWAAAKDPKAFVTYYRRIVRAFRSVPGQKFQIVWNPARGEQRIAPDKVYPGDDVVDVIALDLYNSSWRKEDADPETRWRNHVVQPYGLDWLRTFAAKHRKPIALPEWGTGTTPNGQGKGDDPVFIRNMGRWIADNNVAFHGYWDYKAGDFDAEISSNRQPKSALAFHETFGPKSR